MRLCPTPLCQIKWCTCDIDRTYHERRYSCRPEDTGTHRRHRNTIRRRPALHVPHTPFDKESLWLHIRTGYLRDAAKRLTAGQQSFRASAHAGSRGTLRHCHLLCHRRRSSLPRGDAGPSLFCGLWHTSALSHWFRPAPIEYAIGRS